MSAVGIGIVGLGRKGMHHLERLSLRDDVQLVAVCDRNVATSSRLQGFGYRFFDSWREFLHQPDSELVLIATPPEAHAVLAIEALAMGKHVVVESPLCLTAADADAMLDAARLAERMLSVVQIRRWNEDFRAALAAIESGNLGHLQAAKLITWEYGISTPHNRGALVELGAHYFDQLLQLVPDSVDTIYAHTQPVGADYLTERPAEADSRVGPDIDQRQAAQLGHRNSSGQHSHDAFLAIVNFRTGVTAQVEVNLSSPTSFSTGWMLTGSQGGYHNLHTFTRTAEGEIYSSPIDCTAANADDFYSGIIRHLRQQSPLPVTPEESRRVVCLIESARRSADAGQVIPAVD